MKIVIVGATGTIGKAVTAELGKRHEIIQASSKSTELKMDMTSSSSIKDFYVKVGRFDALKARAIVVESKDDLFRKPDL